MYEKFDLVNLSVIMLALGSCHPACKREAMYLRSLEVLNVIDHHYPRQPLPSTHPHQHHHHHHHHHPQQPLPHLLHEICRVLSRLPAKLFSPLLFSVAVFSSIGGIITITSLFYVSLSLGFGNIDDQYRNSNDNTKIISWAIN